MSILDAFPANEFPALAAKLTIHQVKHGNEATIKMAMAMMLFNEFKDYIKATVAAGHSERVPMLVKILAWTMTELHINKPEFELLQDAFEADLRAEEKQS